MNIFILEDSEHRIKKFKKKYKDCELTIFNNAFEAYEHLCNNEFDYDIMLLDHDLDHKIFCSKRYYNTGLKFLHKSYRIIKQAECLKGIIIHSWNPIGAYRMKDALRKSGKKVVWKPCRWPI